MANTYTSLHYHIVFSTKKRRPLIQPHLQDRVWSFIGGIANENRVKPLTIGGTTDHVHLLIGMPPSIAVSQIVQIMKGGSSHWAGNGIPELRHFEWQDGYGAFTVSKSLLETVSDYIRSQADHHRKKTFQEEYRELLIKHECDFDERYYLD